MDKRVALVTGGGSGIGAATAERLAGSGHHVVVADRDDSSARKVAATLTDRGLSAEPLQIDVGIVASIEAAFEAIDEKHGRCDILINNAGTSHVRDFLDFPDDLWQSTMNINVTGSFRCSQRAARSMRERQWGRIVNISSVSGIRASLGRIAYGPSKAAVDALTRQLAVELGGSGITSNAVAPGPIDTPLAQMHHSETTRNAYYRQIPLRRYGTPDDIASAVAFLASDDAGFINGHTLPVDGGFVAAGLLEM